MNNKLSALFGLVAALGLSTGIIASTVTAAKADPNTMQQQGGQQQRMQGRGDRMAQELNLTQEQQTRIRQIRESAKQQMQSVLTAEQRTQVETARQQRQRPNLNLTEQQRQQMRQIRESTKQQIDAVLTPEQRVRAEQLRQQHQQQRQQHRQQRQQGQAPSGTTTP